MRGFIDRELLKISGCFFSDKKTLPQKSVNPKTMKTLFFILATSFLCCASSFGQMITAEIIINGDPHRNHFSRSEQNSNVVKGMGGVISLKSNHLFLNFMDLFGFPVIILIIGTLNSSHMNDFFHG